MKEPDFLRFASEATIIALWGAGLLLIAGFALLAEWRRSKRRRIDAVGFMPWTPLFLASSICGIALLMVAVKGWLAG